MTRSLWLDPSFGASGDMLLGVLAGLVAEDEPGDVEALLEELTDAVRGIQADGWQLATSTVIRAGISATRVEVVAETGPARHWRDIDAQLEASELPTVVATGARRTFRLLGEVEAAQHDVPIDAVHFHEVGAVDAIVDIVGAWWLLDRLEVADVAVGPVGLGHGTVRAAHGLLPIPAPATLELLRGAPVRSLDASLETCTPTGAALLRSFGRWGPIPDGRIVGAARGAGHVDPTTHPNVLTGVLVELDATDRIDAVEHAIVLSTNVDDVTAEVLGHLVNLLLDAGADDAWVSPILMKKGRPAHQVNALVTPDLADRVRELIAVETGTLGVRSSDVAKYVAPRRVDVIEIRDQPVRIKVGPHGAKPEHDDLVALSLRTGVPVRVLTTEANAEWSATHRRDHAP